MKKLITILIIFFLMTSRLDANVGVIFGVFNFSEKVYAWIGVVESSSQKLDRLIASHLEGAKENLKQALVISNKNTKRRLIEDAIGRLNQATALHKGSQRSVELLARTEAFTGLYICYTELKEKHAAKMALKSISELSTKVDRWEAPFSGGWTFGEMELIAGIPNIARMIRWEKERDKSGLSIDEFISKKFRAVNKDYDLFLRLREQAIKILAR